MPEKPKADTKRREQEKDAPEKASWSEDQKENKYYYDDSHGYEVYSPDDDDQELGTVTQTD
jgi:ribosomal 30S subunit maturation factor RimM